MKLTQRNFKELLLSLQTTPIQDQGEALRIFITNYRKNIAQVDDIF